MEGEGVVLMCGERKFLCGQKRKKIKITRQREVDQRWLSSK